ncbi:hypothetical protein F383_20710 [Gossypium arboreum]|uniref:Uncharacterized protein n=1 Tax=Gossypium arboreum TaxID=29729 RepID=A0A0B0NYP0_GOSAR|nr:hypothetical protein F383_20710 [Gossypium arboreum]
MKYYALWLLLSNMQNYVNYLINMKCYQVSVLTFYGRRQRCVIEENLV